MSTHKGDDKNHDVEKDVGDTKKNRLVFPDGTPHEDPSSTSGLDDLRLQVLMVTGILPDKSRNGHCQEEAQQVDTSLPPPPVPPPLQRVVQLQNESTPGAFAHYPNIGSAELAAAQDGTEPLTVVIGIDEEDEYHLESLVEADPVSLPSGTAQPVDMAKKKQERLSFSRWILIVGCAVGFLVLVCSLTVGVSLRKSFHEDNQNATGRIIRAPDHVSEASGHSSWWDLPFPASQDTLQILNLDRDGSSALSKAYLWMKKDPFLLSYSQDRLVQRFALSSFYFSSQGPNWKVQGGGVTATTVRVPAIRDPLLVHVGGSSQSSHTARAQDEWGPPLTIEVNITSEPWLSYNTSECDWWSTASIENPPPSAGGPPLGGLPPPPPALPFLGSDATTTGTSVCSPNQAIQHLDLRIENGLSGMLPDNLGLLTSLQTLHLAHTNIGGPILPKHIATLTQLVQLDLVESALTSVLPSELGLLSNTLKAVAFIGNALTGTLPAQLFQDLPKLERIMLDHNQFHGTFPTNFTLPNLKLFMMSRNQLTGSLPTTIGHLTSLLNIGLHFNHLTGVLPSQLGNLRNLQEVHLAHNHLSGSLPSELGQIPLIQFALAGNRDVVGTLPPQLQNWNQTLQALDIRGTSITGTIPEVLCKIGDNNLQFDCSSSLCGCTHCPCE